MENNYMDLQKMSKQKLINLTSLTTSLLKVYKNFNLKNMNQQKVLINRE